MDKKKLYRDLDSFQMTHLNESFQNISITIILVRPESVGNIGAIARVMKNFNFKNLIIFNPMESNENILSYRTQGFAMHGTEILYQAEIINLENQEEHLLQLKTLLKKFDLIIATTSKGKKYSNITRLAIFPEDFLIPISENPLHIALLFGKESRGLTNDEIGLSDILLRIPTGEEYSALNLSHAVAIILYELFKKLYIINIGRGKKPVLLADREDRQVLYNLIVSLLEKVKTKDFKKQNAHKAFKNIFERGFMSKKELSLIMGLFSKLDILLDKY